jgi:uncharacterized protein YdaU (DUF1376 family)
MRKQQRVDSMHYYQHHIGDYRRDTAHLSLLEHGIYRQLMDWYYLEETPIPKETEVVFRRLRVGSEIEQKAAMNVLSDFFTLAENGYLHGRIEQEIAQYRAKSERARENGKSGGRPKKQELTENQKPTKTKAVISGNPEQTQEKANHKPLTINQEPDITTSSVKTDRCPTAQIIELFHTHAPSLVQPKIVPDSVKAQIAARWRESEIHQSLDFWSGFFVYCEQSDFLAGRTDGRGGKPFRAGLEWVVKASSFAKIINGNYHGQGPLL